MKNRLLQPGGNTPAIFSAMSGAARRAVRLVSPFARPTDAARRLGQSARDGRLRLVHHLHDIGGYSEPESGQPVGARAQDWPWPIQASATPRMAAFRFALRELSKSATAALRPLKRDPTLSRGPRLALAGLESSGAANIMQMMYYPAWMRVQTDRPRRAVAVEKGG